MDVEKKLNIPDPRPVEVAEGFSEDVRPAEEFPLWKRWLMHLWDADQHLKSPEVRSLPICGSIFAINRSNQERKLVRKLDFGILICATLGWWMKYIDQSNISNACKSIYVLQKFCTGTS